MRITFLGTGAAGGVPLFGCDCVACVRAHDNPQFRREESTDWKSDRGLTSNDR